MNQVPIDQTSAGQDAHPALELFASLVAVPSPSGWETMTAALVRAWLDDWGYAPETDGAGNVFVRLPGRDPDAPLVCYAAHMDEIGMFVQQIDACGNLRVQRLGGLHPWKLGEGPVQVLGDTAIVVGVLSMGAGHGVELNRPIDWGDVHIMTGLSPAQLAAAGVRAGSPAVPIHAGRGPVLFGDPADPLVAAWTFDDRMGVVALLRLLDALRRDNLQPAAPTIVAFTVQEEVGGVGAKLIAQRERPEVFIAIDGCPIPPSVPLALDGRPGIWTHDKLAPYDARLVRDLMSTAQAAGVTLQPAAYHVSASDASMVFDIGAAPRIACFGHVRENSHGYEVARLSVFDQVLRTLIGFVTTWAG
jgi:putative aminopeptidase FrvX